MKWYGAHVVLLIEFKDGIQDVFPTWENIYLIQASTPDEAIQKAERKGKTYEEDADETFTWNDRPAKMTYQGVRKIVQVSNTSSIQNDISDGAEITYQSLEFASREILDNFLDNETCIARIEE